MLQLNYKKLLDANLKTYKFISFLKNICKNFRVK